MIMIGSSSVEKSHCIRIGSFEIANKKCHILESLCEVYYYFFILTQLPLVGQGLLIHNISRSQQRRTTVGRSYLDE